MIKRIYLTVDVECHNIEKINSYIWGLIGGNKYGLEKIVAVANEMGIPINFFVDFAEARRFGEDYVLKIVNTIQNNGHNVYLHIHPNYISGDDSRTFLWEYSYDEQKHILTEGFNYYYKLTGKNKCAAFRIGRYAANENMYKALLEIGVSTIDLSYCYLLPKMCKLSYQDIQTVNAPTTYYGQYIIPNTRYIGFDYFGKKKAFNLDVAESSYGEFCDVIDNARLPCIVLTMHSWDFIKRFFFLPNYIAGDNKVIAKFKKIINYAQQGGFVFCDLKNDLINDNLECDDILYNPVQVNLYSQVKYLIYNFVRFKRISRINKKYFAIYSLLYMITATILFIGLILVIHYWKK